MAFHSFVDESKYPSYLMVASLIRPAHLSHIRKAIAAMIMPGQRRLHFHNERESRKSQIMSRFLELPVEAAIYRTDEKHEGPARERILGLLARDHVARDVRRLVL